MFHHFQPIGTYWSLWFLSPKEFKEISRFPYVVYVHKFGDVSMDAICRYQCELLCIFHFDYLNIVSQLVPTEYGAQMVLY